MADSLISDRTNGSEMEEDFPSHANSGIFLIICVLPLLGTLIFGAVDNTTWILITILWAAIILLWTVESWKTGAIRLSDQPLQIPLLGVLVIGLIQLLPFGPAGDIAGLLSVPASHSISVDPQATRFFWSRVAVYIVFFAACLTFIRSEQRLKKIVIMIIIFGSVMAFFGILQRLANPEGIYGLRETPQAVPFGPFVNQHHFASFMQMTAGITLGFLFGSSLKRDKKILLVIAFVVMGVAIILTGSRGGLIGLLSVILLVTLINAISGRWSAFGKSAFSKASLGRNMAVGVAIAGLMFVVFGVVLFVGGEDSLMRGIGMTFPDSDITTGRGHFWSIALRMFLDNPLIGVGWDAFGAAFTAYDTKSGFFRVEQAHNEYLQFLSEGGILGFLCLAGFIYLLFRQSLKTITGGSGIIREASIGALAGCFGVIIHSFFDFPLRTPSNGFFFLMLSAVAVFPVTRPRKI